MTRNEVIRLAREFGEGNWALERILSAGLPPFVRCSGFCHVTAACIKPRANAFCCVNGVRPPAPYVFHCRKRSK